MTFEEIKTIVTAVVASLGGITGIIAIINAIVRIFTTAKTTRAAKANTGALTAVKDELMNEIDNKLNCSLDVDISAKLNDVLENIERKYLDKARDIDDKLNAMRELNVEMAKLMSTSRKITEEKRAELGALIDRCEGLIAAPEIETKPKLKIELKAPAVTEVQSDEEQAKRRHVTV